MVKAGDKVRILHNGWCDEDRLDKNYRYIYNGFEIGQIVEVVDIELSVGDTLAVSVVGKFHGYGDEIFQSVSNTKDMKVFEVV